MSKKSSERRADKPATHVAITGAASGIGRATALRLASAGARVACMDIRGAASRAVATDIAAQGSWARGFEVDVTDERSVERAFESAFDALGGLDTLVVSAGVAWRRKMHELPLSEWRQILDINLTGMFLASRAVLPYMMDRRRGSIVAVSSIAAIRGVRGLPAYAASKGGVNALTMQLAADYAEYGVRVNAVCPGRVSSDLSANSKEILGVQSAPEPDGSHASTMYPLGDGTADDVANAIAFLASPAATWLTGVVMTVDGGYTIMG